MRDRLQLALVAAMKARDDNAVRALRSVLARLDNAQAVDAPTVSGTGLAIERTPAGVGAAEAPRRELTEAAALALVLAEIRASEDAAVRYEAAGASARAADLRAGADAVKAVIEE